MKLLINSLFIALTLSFAPVYANADAKKEEVKKVCIDKVTKDGKPVMDPKTGKQAQDCKEMKVHKKLEGTKVPEKK